tara:strand:- start:776 stop:1546 length:771 start_codon:yes stop_codon:yes gene_type:complete
MSKAQTLDNLRRLQLVIPPVDYTKVFKYLYSTIPDYLDDAQAPAEPAILNELQIADMVGFLFPIHISRAPIGVEGAFRILNDPLMRRLMTCLALASITSEEMELIVNSKYSVNYATEDIESFLYYFFNLAAFTYHEKREYVELIGDPELKRYYKIALTGDKDYLMWKLGVAPNIPYEVMLKEMLVDCFYSFKESHKHNAEAASRWGQLAVKLSDKLDKISKETQSQVDDLEDFEFQTFNEEQPQEEEIKSICDLDK